MTKLSLVLILVFVVASLSACEREVEHTVYTEPSKPDKNGTVSGGGGNGVDDHPFEDFIKDPIEMAGSEDSLVSQIIYAVGKTYLPLGGDLFYIAKGRKWYFIPVELEQLDPVTLGTFVQGEQYALQSNREVYVSLNHFTAMSASAKSHLILHELVMGAQILAYLGNLEMCLDHAAQSLFVSAPAYEEKRTKCLVSCQGDLSCQVNNLINVRARLTPNDYNNIRELTDELMTRFDNLDPEYLKAWLKVHKFGIYK